MNCPHCSGLTPFFHVFFFSFLFFFSFHLTATSRAFSTNLRMDGLSSGYNKPRLATASAWPQGPSWLGSGPHRPPGPSQPHQRLSGQASWPQRPDAGRRMLPCSPPRLRLHPAAGCQLWRTFSLAPLFVWSLPDSLPPEPKSRSSSFVRSPALKCCRY